MSSDSFDTAFDKIRSLATDFRANAKFLFSTEYQEAQVRKDYIDKVFIALSNCQMLWIGRP